MKMSLKNKVIVVTGGNGLIGSCIVKELKSNGSIAINADISNENDISNGLVYCDVTNTESVIFAISIILKKYHKIDGWVNNAYPRTNDWGDKFENIEYSSWSKNIDSQLNSVFICSKAILAIMKEQGFGSVVNISSIYGVVGPDFSVYDGTEMTMPAAYSAIKGGIINFTRYLASYFGQFGVRVNCVSPGGIFDNQTKIFVDQYEKKVPMKRMGRPEDISPSVTFLLSESASYITGQNLIVDGGWTAI